MKRPVTGHLIKAAGCIPVKRPQDQKREIGAGRLVELEDKKLKGKGTKFTQLTEGTSIYIQGLPELKIKTIISDTELEVTQNVATFKNESKQYKIMIKLNFESLFEKVW